MRFFKEVVAEFPLICRRGINNFIPVKTSASLRQQIVVSIPLIGKAITVNLKPRSVCLLFKFATKLFLFCQFFSIPGTISSDSDHIRLDWCVIVSNCKNVTVILRYSILQTRRKFLKAQLKIIDKCRDINLTPLAIVDSSLRWNWTRGREVK